MVRWLAVDKQGRIAAYLPQLTVSGPLRRTMGRIETLSATLTVDKTTDPDWRAATSEYSCAVLAYDGDPGYEAVVWGGIVESRGEDLLGNTIALNLVSFESYLDRCMIGDQIYSDYPQSLIVSDLANLYAGNGSDQYAGQNSGWLLEVQFGSADPSLTKRRDRTYTADQDKSVYSAISELAAVDGGPQWMVTWQWLPNMITPTLIVGDRIGRPAVAGRPGVTFTSQMMTSARRVTDYSKGRGANVVTATSSPGGVRMARTVSAAAEQPTRPHVEHRFSPSTSITNPDTLTQHAARAVQVMKDGAQTISFVLARAAAPKVGIDWDLGDDIGYAITSPTLGLTPGRPAVPGVSSEIPRTIPYAIGASSAFVPATPDTYGVIEGVAQCIGYELTETTITPYLASMDPL